MATSKIWPDTNGVNLRQFDLDLAPQEPHPFNILLTGRGVRMGKRRIEKRHRLSSFRKYVQLPKIIASSNLIQPHMITSPSHPVDFLLAKSTQIQGSQSLSHLAPVLRAPDEDLDPPEKSDSMHWSESVFIPFKFYCPLLQEIISKYLPPSPDGNGNSDPYRGPGRTLQGPSVHSTR